MKASYLRSVDVTVSNLQEKFIPRDTQSLGIWSKRTANSRRWCLGLQQRAVSCDSRIWRQAVSMVQAEDRVIHTQIIATNSIWFCHSRYRLRCRQEIEFNNGMKTRHREGPVFEILLDLLPPPLAHGPCLKDKSKKPGLPRLCQPSETFSWKTPVSCVLFDFHLHFKGGRMLNRHTMLCVHRINLHHTPPDHCILKIRSLIQAFVAIPKVLTGKLWLWRTSSLWNKEYGFTSKFQATNRVNWHLCNHDMKNWKTTARAEVLHVLLTSLLMIMRDITGQSQGNSLFPRSAQSRAGRPGTGEETHWLRLSIFLRRAIFCRENGQNDKQTACPNHGNQGKEIKYLHAGVKTTQDEKLAAFKYLKGNLDLYLVQHGARGWSGHKLPFQGKP